VAPWQLPSAHMRSDGTARGSKLLSITAVKELYHDLTNHVLSHRKKRELIRLNLKEACCTAKINQYKRLNNIICALKNNKIYK
jgi:hypothetical protein